MLSKKYIHYGSDHFDPEYFNNDFDDNRYENCGWHWSKPFNPRAGLWASPEICHYSWRNFCVDEQFNLSDLNSSFIFTIKHPENMTEPDSLILKLVSRVINSHPQLASIIIN